MKSKPSAPLIKLPIGTRVMIKRPNLWAGEEGVVTRYTSDRNIVNLIRNNANFEVAAKGEELEAVAIP